MLIELLTRPNKKELPDLPVIQYPAGLPEP